MLLGRMMHQPLSVGSLIDHAARYHGDTEIVSALTEGGFERTTWGEVGANARRYGSTWLGWIAAFAPKPDAAASTASACAPSRSWMSARMASIAVMPKEAAASRMRLRAYIATSR